MEYVNCTTCLTSREPLVAKGIEGAWGDLKGEEALRMHLKHMEPTEGSNIICISWTGLLWGLQEASWGPA